MKTAIYSLLIFLSKLSISNHMQLCQKATTGVFNLIGDKARRFPDQILGDPFKLNAKLETGRYAYPFVCFSDFAVLFKSTLS